MIPRPEMLGWVMLHGSPYVLEYMYSAFPITPR
jgi:hypothetical protein